MLITLPISLSFEGIDCDGRSRLRVPPDCPLGGATIIGIFCDNPNHHHHSAISPPYCGMGCCGIEGDGLGGMLTICGFSACAAVWSGVPPF